MCIGVSQLEEAMQYNLLPDRAPTLPYFLPGTSGTKLTPREGRLLAAMRLPYQHQRLEDTPDEQPSVLKFTITGIDGPDGTPVGEFLVFASDWLIVPQPGYAYAMRNSCVQPLGGATTAEPTLRQHRKASPDELTRTTVGAIQGVWQASGGPDVPVYGLARLKAAYVYGEVAPHAKEAALSVFGGTFVLDPEKWIDKRLLLISESDRARSCPRVVPLTYLAREFAAWTREDGTVIVDFG
jgi:hypothetical protein